MTVQYRKITVQYCKISVQYNTVRLLYRTAVLFIIKLMHISLLSPNIDNTIFLYSTHQSPPPHTLYWVFGYLKPLLPLIGSPPSLSLLFRLIYIYLGDFVNGLSQHCLLFLTVLIMDLRHSFPNLLHQEISQASQIIQLVVCLFVCLCNSICKMSSICIYIYTYIDITWACFLIV